VITIEKNGMMVGAAMKRGGLTGAGRNNMVI
jgi:hypothetical protein